MAFRKWANQIVSEYTIKGWVMDVPRLKDGSPISDKYFEHQLERIREIRLSERMFYQKITDLYATAIDYDKTSNMTRIFYATVQNRMHWFFPMRSSFLRRPSRVMPKSAAA